MALGFYMDNKDCYGCKTCMIACKGEKQLNDKVLLRVVRVIKQDEPKNAVSFLSMACNHCDEPTCMGNCPVGAYTKLDNGVVVQNHSLCIGCQTCISVCPYQAPCYDEVTGKTFKCDMCIDRQEQGLMPSCVASCPGMNIAVGEMSELQSEHSGATVSDDTAGTMPNFVITVDPLLTTGPEKSAIKS
jgi:Fe-S-cluster-containing dehydrogenase component